MLAYELRFAPSNAKIYAPGQVNYPENLAIVKACSFGISPTLIENFGMALLEASICGVPMVAFDVGGNADVVSNGRSGVLVPFLDFEALIQSACRLLDAEYRANLRSEAVSYAADRFSSDLTVEKFVSLMQ